MDTDRPVANPYAAAEETASPGCGRSVGWLLLAAIAAAGLVYALYGAVETTAFLWSATTAEGKVAEAEPHPSRLPWSLRRIVVAFADEAGRPQRAEIVTGFAYDVGDPVVVAYRPGRPERARLRGLWSLYGTSAVLLAASLGFLRLAWPRWRGLLDWPPRRSSYESQQIVVREASAVDVAEETPPDEEARCTVHTEAVEVTDAHTGEAHVYRSLDECPPEVRARIEQQNRDLEAMLNGSTRAEFTFTDEHGAERTCHTREEFLRQVAEMLDRFTDSEVP